MFDEEAGEYTSSIHRILQMVHNAWEPILNRHQHEPPSFTDFEHNYGTHFANWTPAPTEIPGGTELHRQAQKAKEESAAGSDGWRPIELAWLPAAAWEHRAKVLAVATKRR